MLEEELEEEKNGKAVRYTDAAAISNLRRFDLFLKLPSLRAPFSRITPSVSFIISSFIFCCRISRKCHRSKPHEFLKTTLACRNQRS